MARFSHFARLYTQREKPQAKAVDSKKMVAGFFAPATSPQNRQLMECNRCGAHAPHKQYGRDRYPEILDHYVENQPNRLQHHNLQKQQNVYVATSRRVVK